MSGLIFLAALAAVFLLAFWVIREPGAPKPDWMPFDWWPFDSRSDSVEATAAIEDRKAAAARPSTVPWRERRAATEWRQQPVGRTWSRRSGGTTRGKASSFFYDEGVKKPDSRRK